ncbi:sigma-54-dependent Fis family transcriptional regulator [Desulfoprunum benzoelyticum]|uniref:Two-component system response regulator AtoC n=1 Tax=Desulfoprunum benzoelyticum TaxID=1506996 RepID=A0A840UST6_9BACT|nr:sigma-54 dependent transcriptional regulator [Desulfoprunum benzoelyticum]MBB5348715.1 two-component system response regulator AtoC [Desulfoprunum benzoelyticum]MBM9530010.1 sigma-54-dependent Fis family transcriptional regulator [Desulfoprunum benzoelyticum]
MKLKILLIDDEISILETLEMFFTEKGHQVMKAETGETGFALFRDQLPDIVIIDIHLPDGNGLEILSRIHNEGHLAKVIMITAYHDMATTIEAMKSGAFDYIHKPLDVDLIEDAIQRVTSILEAEQEEKTFGLPQSKDFNPNLIIGNSDQMRKIFKTIGLACQKRTTVLIQGETGTGKEVVARAIHRNSIAANEPFVTLDCSSVVTNLIESELFGHVEGAFTGANRTQKGKIELAGNGTLFLDEIGELAYEVQGKLLGFLQRHEYMRVGGQETLKSNCRIIAATNRDLFNMVNQHEFRRDLFYRLRVVIIQLPPLRERLSDIDDLVDYFLQKINLRLNTEVLHFQAGVLERLKVHQWPGNVRELENVLIEAVVQTRGSVLLLNDIDKILRKYRQTEESDSSIRSLVSIEKEHIKNTLDALNWRRTEAAQRLEISLPTLRSKIQKYNIKPPDGCSFH